MRPSSTRNPNLDTARVESTRPPPPERDELVGPRPAWWWTGRAPRPGECPGVRDDGTIASVAVPRLDRATRADVLAYFDNAWALTEVLFASLQGEDAFRRAPYHRLRHPLVFYYAHPATFYVNKLRLAGLLETPINDDFETLFQTGVDEMSWDDLSHAETDWPPVRAVTEYRRAVNRAVRAIIESHPGLADGHPTITQGSGLWALFMGIEHERIHFELSSVLVRELPISLVRRPEAWPADAAETRPRSADPRVNVDYPPNDLVRAGASSLLVGKPHASPTFGWDNAYGERHAHVRAFCATKQLISNGEFHQFVGAGGYNERRYWSDDGWGWRSFRNAKWPTFWVSDGPSGLLRFRLRTMFEIVAMPWDWPVLVNYHEAKAFAAWRTEREASAMPYRVLTEAEHHALHDPIADAQSDLADPRHNVDLAFGSEGAVDAFTPTSKGAHDVFGNAWEWIEDQFHPLPGFRVHALYDDFSTPCFDGKHQMILGGSFMSTGDEASAWARFHFRPHFFQHCGFRLARSDDDDAENDAVRLGGATATNVYESRELLDQYMVLHYASEADTMTHAFGPRDALAFPERCARLVVELCARHGVATKRAIDVGCAVGRATFELARTFDEVLGVDLSASFVGVAAALQRDGDAIFRRRDEGELGVELHAVIDPAIARERVSFRQADASALPPELVGFDAVLLANLLCRLPSPRACLARMGGSRGLVRPGGLLVVTSPYTWMEAFTPRDVWLGGFERDGRAVRSVDGLRAALGDEFELVDEREMPLVIREHARKFQYIVAHATSWRRRAR